MFGERFQLLIWAKIKKKVKLYFEQTIETIEVSTFEQYTMQAY